MAPREFDVHSRWKPAREQKKNKKNMKNKKSEKNKKNKKKNNNKKKGIRRIREEDEDKAVKRKRLV